MDQEATHHRWAPCDAERHDLATSSLEPKIIGYRIIPLDKIRLDYACTTNTRMDGIALEELALTYAMEMNAGARFPAIVVCRSIGPELDLYDILGGLTRTMAAREVGLDEVLALVLDKIPPWQARLIKTRLNQINGRQEPLEHVVTRAMEFCLPPHSLPPGQIEKEFRLTHGTLSKQLLDNRFLNDMCAKGIDLRQLVDGKSIPRTILTEIRSIADKCLPSALALAQIVKDNPRALNTTSLKETRRLIKACDTEAGRTAIVKEVAADVKKATKPRTRAPIQNDQALTLMATTRKLRTLFAQTTDLDFMTQEQLTDYAKTINEIYTHINRIKKATKNIFAIPS